MTKIDAARKNRATLILSLLGALGVAMGLCTSADAEDVFQGCSSNLTNRIRSSSLVVNAMPTCKPSETARSWTQGGGGAPAGSRQPITGAFFSGPDVTSPNLVPVAILEVGDGPYAVTAHAQFWNHGQIASFVGCILTNGEAQTHDTGYVDIAPGRADGMTLTGIFTSLPRGTIELWCHLSTGPTASFGNVSMVAIPVENPELRYR